LDAELLKLNRVLIAHTALQRRPPAGNSVGRVAELTEMGLIRHEVQKQQQHPRIRDLLRRAGMAAQALKPCFMMSPLSVSQFLDPKGVEFDLVVMDEASQIKPEDALGTLLRAKQLVVVGDPKQLPPTSFFDRMTDDASDDDATQFDNVESVLEVAMKAFQPVRRLRWHYRSKHESLIHFSNDKFYDGDLVVFPSASGLAENLGIRYHAIEEGYFEGGCNVREAEDVANAILKHALNSPDESLGVGTFNAKQAGIILDLVQRICETDSDAREALDRLNSLPEKLFVKNLENLQGDERDVIFISYTYGRDRDSGRVFNRFGPVNGKTGWRRINVLVSRARRRLEVFSSINPSDILGGPNKSDGVNAFRDFLEYAQTGRLPDRGQLSNREMESAFEEAVARVVRQMGLDVVPQVGVAGYFIDLGVRRRGEEDFVLGIECDGATYHSSKSARDRDRLRQEVIVSRGWKLHRVWSTDWYLNQRQEEQRLRQALEAAVAAKASPGIREESKIAAS
jgi:very-short-patch-repair endonuclease